MCALWTRKTQCAVAVVAGLRLTSAVPASAAVSSPGDEADVAELWRKFGQTFPHAAAVASEELGNGGGDVPAVFASNVRQAVAMNAEAGADCTRMLEGEGCVYGLTKFSALSPEQFGSRLGYSRDNSVSLSGPSAAAVAVDGSWQAPDKVDWRAEGAVTPVKDQGECGSCWAFSVTSEVESAHYMKTKQLVELSTQQVISCDRRDLGCDGGDPIAAYQYMKKAGGLDVATDYPDRSHTTGRTGKCTWDHNVSVSVSGYKYAVKPCQEGPCKHQDEDGLKRALAVKGPVSICVSADSWQSYTGGIVKSDCPSDAETMDHCVQLVGYDTTGPVPFWIIRNSWAEDWGIDGYIHVKMGHNFCGIANEATFAVTDKSETSAIDDVVVV